MNHATRVYDNIFELLPGEDNPTPLVRLNRLNTAADFPLYAKLEWMNPFGSVKDRAAWALLRELEENGELGNGRGIVEPTSGNTGISLAAMARTRGHHMRAVVPNKVPLEKKVLLKIAGADLDVVSDELCPAPGLGDGSINLAKTHAKASSHKYAMPNQYRKPDQRRSAFPHHRPRNLAADRRPHHASVCFARHVRHGDGRQQISAEQKTGCEGGRSAADRRP